MCECFNLRMENALILDKSTAETVREYLPKNDVLNNMVNFFSLFSDVTRVKMLSALSIAEMCVTDLAAVLDINQTTVSHQLKLLRDSGFVKYRREGKVIYYSARKKTVNDVMMTGVVYLGY